MAENVHGSALCWGAYVALVFLAVPACGQIALFIDEQGIRYDGLRLGKTVGDFLFFVIVLAPIAAAWMRAAMQDRPTSPSREGPPIPASWLAVAAVIALELTLFYKRGPFNPEEMSHAIISATHHIREVLQGFYPFWNHDLGFGMPHPMMPSLIHHPLLPLFLLDLHLGLTLLYAVHLSLGGLYFTRICRHLGLPPPIALVCTLSYLLSGPILMYLTQYLWLSSMTIVTTFPVILYYVMKLLDDERHQWRRAIALGLTTGLAFANSHPGFFSGFALPIGMLAAVRFRDLYRRRWPISLAVLIATLIATQNIVHFLLERGRFESGLGHVDFFFNHYSEVIRGAWGKPIFLLPLDRLTEAWEQGGWFAPLRVAAAEFISRNFQVNDSQIGLPFAWIAVMAVIWRGIGDRWRIPFAVALIACVIGTAAPRSFYYLYFSGNFVFAQALVPFAILLAGIVLRHVADRGGAQLVKAALSAQLAFAGIAITPTVLVVTAPDALAGAGLLNNFYVNRIAAARRFNDIEPSAIAQAIRRVTPKEHPTVYPSKNINGQFSWLAIRPGLEGEFKNVLSLSGMRMVPGLFKGVSATAWHPSWQRMYGSIGSQASVLVDRPALDVLGIDIILASPDEPRDPGLKLLDQYHLSDGSIIDILNNPTAWPAAMVISDRLRSADLSIRPGCEHDRLLCADFTPVIAAARPEVAVAATRAHGRFRLQMTPDKAPRLIMLSESYRGGWKASSPNGQSVEVVRLWGGVLGVVAPAGATEIEVRYAPLPEILAAAISHLGLAAATILLVMLLWRSRVKSRSATDEGI